MKINATLRGVEVSATELFDDFGGQSSTEQLDALSAIGTSLDCHMSNYALTMQAQYVADAIRGTIRPNATREGLVVLHKFLTDILEEK